MKSQMKHKRDKKKKKRQRRFAGGAGGAPIQAVAAYNFCGLIQKSAEYGDMPTQPFPHTHSYSKSNFELHKPLSFPELCFERAADRMKHLHSLAEIYCNQISSGIWGEIVLLCYFPLNTNEKCSSCGYQLHPELHQLLKLAFEMLSPRPKQTPLCD